MENLTAQQGRSSMSRPTALEAIEPILGIIRDTRRSTYIRVDAPSILKSLEGVVYESVAALRRISLRGLRDQVQVGLLTLIVADDDSTDDVGLPGDDHNDALDIQLCGNRLQ